MGDVFVSHQLGYNNTAGRESQAVFSKKSKKPEGILFDPFRRQDVVISVPHRRKRSSLRRQTCEPGEAGKSGSE
jgi:hypothetical protein